MPKSYKNNGPSLIKYYKPSHNKLVKRIKFRIP